MAKKTVMKDWLDRDDDYVYRGGHRSGWDDTYKSTSDYVLSGFVKPDNTEAELHEIYKLCKNRSQILSSDKQITLTFNPNEKTAKTDGKKVVVGTGVLSEKFKDFSKKADIMLGLTTHEMAHVLFSTFSHLKKVDDDFHKAILNVIEDERIEYLLCDEFPGYANNIAETKQYFFDDKYVVEDAAESASSEEEKYTLELFDVFFKLVRYPKYLTEEMLDKFEMELDDMKKILNPYPKTAIAAFNASKEIRDLFKKLALKKSKELSKESSGSEEPSEELSEESSEESSEHSGSEPATGTGPGSSDSKDAEKLLKETEHKIAEMMKDFMSDNDSEKKVEVSKDVEKVDFSKEIIYDGDNKAMFRTGVPDKHKYNEYFSEVKGDVSRLASSLFTRVFDESTTLRGLRSGNLDESKIVEAATGAKNVHIKTSAKEVKSINIVMLIDESGSMCNMNAYANAAKAAILIEKTFEKFPVGKLFIYGFTSDAPWQDGKGYDFNQIIRYREPGLNIKYGLGNVQARSNNRDGHAIRAVVKRVRSFTNDPMLFFVISDGVPAATKYEGYTDTRAAVLEATKKKFFPIQIGIGPGIRPSVQKEMFDDFIHYDTSGQMVNDLRKLVIRKSQKIFSL
jgi:cobalamin biosynthesis protein CobT